MEKRRVVITGMGTVNPIGNSVAESWQAAKDGKCGIGPITRYDCSNMRVKLAGEVKDLDIDGILGKREAKKMDRFTQFALIAAQQAMDDSGLDREREDLSRCGVICSSGIGGSQDNLHALAPEANWLDGQRFSSGASQDEVAQWVDSLGLDF